MNETENLKKLRAEIDAIDDQIHDLLMRRTEVVLKVGALKRGSGAAGLALRPGREAAILRRLATRHQGPFPAPVMVRIWRELLSAQVSIQSDFSVVAFAPEGLNVYRDLARDQFGATTPLRTRPSVMQVLTMVDEGAASVGVLPMPVGERQDPWWRGLVAADSEAPQIIARLPFYEATPDAADQPSALVIARTDPDPTGDDITMIAVEVQGSISRDRVRGAFAAHQLAVSWVGAWNDPDDPDHAMHLLAVDRFVGRNEPRLTAIREELGSDAVVIRSLGGYARPLAAGEDPSG